MCERVSQLYKPRLAAKLSTLPDPEIHSDLNSRSAKLSSLCLNTSVAPAEREREILPDSGARFCSPRLARPGTWVFHIVELGVPHVGALADWQQDHHTEKWRKVIYPTACALTFQNSKTMMKKLPKFPEYPDKTEQQSNFSTSMLWGAWPSPIATIHKMRSTLLQVHRLASQSASRSIHSRLRWQQNCGLPAAPCSQNKLKSARPLLSKQVEISKSSPEPLA